MNTQNIFFFFKVKRPIILYGCETWGFGNNEIIERLHLKFCKLHLKSSTPDYMVYGELGRYPISIDIHSYLKYPGYFLSTMKNHLLKNYCCKVIYSICEKAYFVFP
jgi:hypothetical protein